MIATHAFPMSPFIETVDGLSKNKSVEPYLGQGNRDRRTAVELSAPRPIGSAISASQAACPERVL